MPSPLLLRACLGASLLLAATLPSLSTAQVPEAAVRDAARADATVAEAWVSPGNGEEELDSVAAWQDRDGAVWLYATAKGGNQVVVFDAATGARVRAVGGPGDGPGRFARPNGIAVAGDLLFVVERDNRRVQVLSLPALEPLGSFGQEVLRLPYGLWLSPQASADGAMAVEVLVTDSFMQDFAKGVLPPREQLAERVKRFQVRYRDGALQARYAGAFGDTGDGALRMVESIAGDPAHDRLLIAEEDHRVGSTLRDYRLDGRYRGYSLPAFQGDAEGVALWTCGAGAGYWVAAEQLRPTRFHLHARDTLAAAGTFSGARTALTDGLAVFTSPSARFPAGALFALDADRALVAFDLREVAGALALDPRCAR